MSSVYNRDIKSALPCNTSASTLKFSFDKDSFFLSKSLNIIQG